MTPASRIIPSDEATVQQREIEALLAPIRRSRVGAGLSRPLITDRIDTTLDRMEAEQLAIRAIYLGQDDFLELQLLAMKFLDPSRLCTHYRGYPVRPVAGTGPSQVYSTRGVPRAVRKRP